VALIVVGVSHHGASLEVRERLAYRTSEVHGLLDRVRAAADAREAVLLSTCNRTELYVVEGEREAAPAVWSLYGERLGDDASGVGYVRRDRDAVAHLFRVVSGMDSMVVGEAQIPGLADSLRAVPGVEAVSLPAAPARLESANVDAVLEVPDGIAARLAAGDSARVQLVYKESENRSSQAAERQFQQVVAAW
jgi:glutamyl-tRNA reductase